MKKIAIIGGGISGIALANILKSKADVTVFERGAKIGGLISCDVVDNYLYHKVGGHVFNSKNQEVTEWFWKFFDRDSEFLYAKRNAKILLDSKLVNYPIENNFYRLDKATITSVIKDLLSLNKNAEYENFGQFLKENFGETLYNIYFKPYNQKLWNADLDLIPLDWLEGKLPMPDLHNIISSNILKQEESNMVHSYFYYPKNNGSQFIIDRLAQGINVIKNVRVQSITDNASKQLFVNNYGPFDRVVFTGDVRTLPGILQNNTLSYANTDALKDLKSNGTTNVLCACDETDLSWLYIPEEKYKAHRIIYTGNFSNNNNGGNKRASCVVEFSNFLGKEEAIEELKKLPGNLQFVAYHYEPNSYVIQHPGTRALISDVKAELKESGIYLVGRFAEWEYYNMDKAIEAAFTLSTVID